MLGQQPGLGAIAQDPQQVLLQREVFPVFREAPEQFLLHVLDGVVGVIEDQRHAARLLDRAHDQQPVTHFGGNTRVQELHARPGANGA